MVPVSSLIFKNLFFNWLKIAVLMLWIPAVTARFPRLFSKKPRERVRFSDQIVVREYYRNSSFKEFISESIQSFYDSGVNETDEESTVEENWECEATSEGGEVEEIRIEDEHSRKRKRDSSESDRRLEDGGNSTENDSEMERKRMKLRTKNSSTIDRIIHDDV